MDITIRPARPEEYAAAGEVAAQANVDGAGLPPDSSYLPHLRNAADRAVAAELLVAVERDADAPAGGVLGTVTYVPHGSPYAEVARHAGEAEFRMLAVASAARGRGVGEALVRACVQRGREQQVSRLVLCVIAGNPGPQRLYQRVGFTRLPERDWEPFPGEALHAYAMEL